MAFQDIVDGKGARTMLPGGYELKDLADHIECVDGTTLSVQASKMHYCKPRTNRGPFTHVEVGAASVDPPKTWAEYADGDYPSYVYGYVPVELVREYIDSHGGEKK